ncbi:MULTISPECIES: hypothetical protein [unclassified Streptomyces]|uniref:hypothetical protein n=1 Tax=unclassified Streptomyces TaxID=2593676 RepID=UPI002ED1A2CD|nr:hypothetical protein OH827_23355 [Streptomyces sp. NBC_00891]WSY07765.1 hypothetical protein OG464_23355 [Streptomyces sp. NBC_00890]WSZ09391.1 hypothetical protein OG704_23360 [Streptomyces sp. NBC_00869]WSZ23110.1 hypothetical protein OG498_10210 [Streptomyces sp. NBC_00870]
MTIWHVADDQVLRYAQGTAPETDAWSLEKHVESCTSCAERVSAAVRGRGAAAPLLDEVRAAVLAEAVPVSGGAEAGRPVPGLGAWRGRAPGAGPAWRRLPGRHRFGRVLWAAGPALRGPWTGALALVVCAAVALAYGGGLGGSVRALLLLVAPVLPLAGVGVSYGRSADPLHEIIATSPGGGLRLLLTRTAAVLGVTVPVLALAWAVLPASAGGPGPLAWLLPGLALTLAALGIGSYVGCRTAALVVAAGWAAAVTVPALGTSPSALLDGTPTALRYFAGLPAQGAWAVAAVLGAALLVLRRRSFDHLETS